MDQDKVALESLRVGSLLAVAALAINGTAGFLSRDELLFPPMAVNTLAGVGLFAWTHRACRDGLLPAGAAHPFILVLGLYALATVSLDYYCGVHQNIMMRVAAVMLGVGLCMQRSKWLAAYLIICTVGAIFLPGLADEGIWQMVLAVLFGNLASLSSHLSRKHTLAAVDALSAAQMEQNRTLEEILDRAHLLGGSLDEEVTRHTLHLEEIRRELSLTLQQQARLFDEKTSLERQLGEGRRLESLGRAAGAVAHDLNNILAILSCSLEYLQEIRPAGPGQDEIGRAIKQVGKTGREMLTLSGRQVLRQESVEVAILAREWGPLLTGLLGEAYHFEQDLQSPETVLLCDRQQLFQVMAKLFANAAEAMPGGGRLRLAGHRSSQGFYELDLEDEGPGIAAGLRGSVFEPFFTTRDTQKHSGLGLSTARALLVQQGGSLEIDDAPGGGALLRLLLPARGDIRP